MIDAKVETLILGSFPSAVSLRKKQYYGHPQNQFWKLVGRVIGKPLFEMQYEARLKALLAHRIGLWDVIGTCERTGSLDGNVRNARHNDFRRVTRVAKGLKRVCFNGKLAAKLEPWFAGRGLDIVILPSTSPANTMNFDDKLVEWRAAIGRRC